ncbi:endonuclease domain-containing protein [Sphingomonas cannabina]|nr:endonuclease domain-containing protein [Sphingomonas cannabina]
MRLYANQPAGTVTRLRTLRRNATEAEKRLVRALKEAFPTHKWRFQAPLGPFRVDVLCFSERLVIEIDGGQHAEAAAHDAARTRFIEGEGYRVLRFWNNDVMENIEGVIEAIQTSLSHWEREGARSAQPSGKGEGDRA